jgi:hypothetical protein
MKFAHGNRTEVPASLPARLCTWGLSLEAFGLFVAFVSWSAMQEEDGFVPTIIAEKWGPRGKIGRKKLLVELVEAGILESFEGGYDIPLFAVYNETTDRKEIRRRKESKRARAQRFRATVIERDGLVCHICGTDVEPHDVHIDHVLAIAKGGDSELDNLRVSHSRCNLRKGAS